MSEFMRQAEAALAADGEVARVAVVPGDRLGAHWFVGFVERVGQAPQPLDSFTGPTREEQTELDEAFRDRLGTALRAALPEQHSALPIVLIRAIPLDADGEIDREALSQRAGDFLESLTALTEIWAAALKKSEIGAEAAFLASGGTSLAAMQVTNRVRDRFGVRLPLSVLLSRRTATEIAAWIVSDNFDFLEGGRAR